MLSFRSPFSVKIEMFGSRAGIVETLAPLLCVPGFPSGLPFHHFPKVCVFTVFSNLSLLVFNWEVGPLSVGKEPLAISALSIRKASSNALRKLSSRLPSSQETEPCQLAFCRNSTRTANVAHRPSRTSAPGGRPARIGGSEKLRTAVKDCGNCIPSSKSSIFRKNSIRL